MYILNWDRLQKPQRIEVDQSTYSETYGCFIAEPLEQGFGITLGHALRRVLLSSLQGCGVIGVKIAGISHEFEPVHGLKEDLVQILLNLKGLHLKPLEEGIHELELVGAGPAVLRGKDIVTGGKVEVMNPEHEIATLDEEAELEMQLYATMNRGYITAEENKTDELPATVIYIDSVHTPIRRVSYEVQSARVGRRTDYDRLIFELWTNGAMNPCEALGYAAEILRNHAHIFTNLNEAVEPIPEERPQIEAPAVSAPLEDHTHEAFSRPVSELELSTRSINCLQSAHIQTIGDLVGCSEAEMLRTKNFGRKSLGEIKLILESMGLRLGMRQANYDPNKGSIAQ